MRRNSEPLRCLVGVSTLAHTELIEDIGRHLIRQAGERGPRPPVELHAFDVSAIGASQMLRLAEPKAFRDARADRHVVVIGLGSMGQRLVLRIAEAWPDTKDNGDTRRLSFTFVDHDATRHRQTMRTFHEQLRKHSVAAVDADVESLAVAKQFSLLSEAYGQPTDIFICVRDDAAGLNAARSLRSVFEDVPIVVRTKTYRGLPSLHRVTGAGANIQTLNYFTRRAIRTLIEEWFGEASGVESREWRESSSV